MQPRTSDIGRAVQPRPVRRANAMTWRYACVLAPVLLFGASHAALGCHGTVVAMSAEAYAPPPTSQSEKKGPNEFELHPAANTIANVPAMNLPKENVSVCADLSMLSTADEADSGVGVMFWMAGDDNYYFFEISPVGKYRVVHVLAGKWYQLLAYAESPAIVKGVGKWNEVELRPADSMIQIWINGEMVNSVIARRVGAAGLYGPFGESPKAAPAVMRVRSLRLMKQE